MTPKHLIEKIMKIKNHQNTFTMCIAFAMTMIACKFDDNIINVISIVSGVALITIISKVNDRRILDMTDDNIKEENYELSVLLMSRKLVLPSKIKPLLEEVAKSEEEQK